MTYLKQQGGYEISDDRARIDVSLVHGFLKHAYWCRGVPRSVVERAIDGSLCFGIYAPDGAQVGFGRSVTDGATFAYFSDLFVVEALRGNGLGRFLVDAMMDHPMHQDLRHMLLATDDAQRLYAHAGFESVPGSPYMNRLDLERYQRGESER